MFSCLRNRLSRYARKLVKVIESVELPFLPFLPSAEDIAGDEEVMRLVDDVIFAPSYT